MDEPLKSVVVYPTSQRRVDITGPWINREAVLISDIKGVPDAFTPVRGEKGVYYARRQDVPTDGKWEVNWMSNQLDGWRDPMSSNRNNGVCAVRRKPEPETEMVPWHEAKGRISKDGSPIARLTWVERSDVPEVQSADGNYWRGHKIEVRK